MNPPIAAPTTVIEKSGTENFSSVGHRRLVSAAMKLPLFLVAIVVITLALAGVHLTQGTAAVGPADLWHWVTGAGTDDQIAVILASRLPRLLAGILVGVALGAAGAALQSVSRNVLASPDTLAVNAGAYLAMVVVAAFGISLPFVSSGAVAFAGGLVAAGIALALSGGGSGPIRLVLAGSALALAFSAGSTVLLLLFPQQTTGLYAWGNGTTSQIGLSAVTQLGPIVLAGVLMLVLLGRRLDILGLGDDSAAVLGIGVRRTRAAGVVIAVLLAAAAVTVAGPIGFVGLCAPALVRLLASRIPGLHRHRVLIPSAALVGVMVVLGADVLLRLVFGNQAGVSVPTGVVTTVLGAVFLVALAYRVRDSGRVTSAGFAAMRSRRAFIVTMLALIVVLVGVVIASVLLGDAKLLLGDVANWVQGRAAFTVQLVLDTRMPRVLAALLAGAALAVAGGIVQAVSRNPLAEPGILGVVGGAGVASITVLTIVPLASFWLVGAAGMVGAGLAAALVFGLAARGGLEQNRLVLIGIGVSSGTAAVISLLIVLTDPFNAAKALTWMSGSTYGRTFAQLWPLGIALAASVPLLAGSVRELDLLSLDDDTPRLLGVPLGRTRLVLLSVSVVLTAAAVAAIGVIGFVGLVAPHAARALVGRRHARVLPVAALLGALLVCVADVLGRTVIAPAQLPAGLVTAVIGAPYFLWLLWRGRTERS